LEDICTLLIILTTHNTHPLAWVPQAILYTRNTLHIVTAVQVIHPRKVLSIETLRISMAHRMVSDLGMILKISHTEVASQTPKELIFN
jgi:hypothetical protein